MRARRTGIDAAIMVVALSAMPKMTSWTLSTITARQVRLASRQLLVSGTWLEYTQRTWIRRIDSRHSANFYERGGSSTDEEKGKISVDRTEKAT